MSGIFVCGTGAVSPAGWGVPQLSAAVTKGEPIPAKEIARPGWKRTLLTRTVPAPSPRPAFMTHARLRRTSPIAQYAVAAALEALGGAPARAQTGGENAGDQLGIILCVMSGCVNYSRRFYDETIKDPATASPVVFPETVFNAPASHLAALLGTTAINYTLVGDQGTFLQGLALAADWLLSERVDGCLVVAAEESDWLVVEAFHCFARSGIVSDGAGALYLRREPLASPGIELAAITDSHLITKSQPRGQAARRACAELAKPPAPALLSDGIQGIPALDQDENEGWKDWAGQRLSPKLVLGEAFTAGAAWQCVAALDALGTNGFVAADVSVVGCNQQAIAARFVKIS